MARILILASFALLHLAADARDLDKLYKKEKFKLGARTLEVYMADTDVLRADGLMFITKLPQETGMLFVFEQEQPLSFWMKNTMIPLAIGFLDAKGVLVDIQEMTPASSMVTLDIPTYHSRKPARFALEMNKGWFAKNGVKIGAKLRPFSKPLADSLGLPTSGLSK